MARIHTVGMETGVLAKEIEDAGASLETSFVRSGGYSWKETWAKIISGSPQTIYMGIAFAPVGINNGGYWLRFSDGSVYHVSTKINADGSIDLVGPTGSTVDTSDAGAMTAGVWSYIEIYFYCADSSGRFHLKIDGVTAIDYTGDTKNGTGNFTKIHGTGGGSWEEYYWDDFVLNDTSGSSNNSWPGSIKLVPVRPNAAGDNTGLTPSSGSSNYQCVDEVPHSDTDYVYDTVVDEYDLYNCGTIALPIGAVITNVIVQAVAKMDSGTGNIALMVKSGSTTDTGSDQSLGISSTLYEETYDVNPDDSAAWEQSDIDSIQIGVKTR